MEKCTTTWVHKYAHTQTNVFFAAPLAFITTLCLLGLESVTS